MNQNKLWSSIHIKPNFEEWNYIKKLEDQIIKGIGISLFIAIVKC
jgi:hypothetical protein